MKNTVKYLLVMSTLLLTCLYFAGCGKEAAEETAELAATDVQTETEYVSVGSPPEQRVQESPPESPASPEEAPGTAIAEVSEEDIAAVLMAVQNAVAEESELWYFVGITDREELTLLMESYGGAGQRREGMTPPEDQPMELPEGEMPFQNGNVPERNRDMPKGDGEMPQGNGGAPEDGEFSAQGGGQGRTSGGVLPSLAVVIANTEGATVSIEEIIRSAEEIVSDLGYRLVSTAIEESSWLLPAVSEGFSHNTILFVAEASTPQESRPE